MTASSIHAKTENKVGPADVLFHGSSTVTKLAPILHVAAGTVALLAGIIAMSSRKGARVHRVAGTLFCVSMLGMAVLADHLAVATPEQILDFFIGTFTIYLVATAWMTLRRKQRSVGVPEKTPLSIVVCLCLLSRF
jgi:uncharacterized membrane protein YfcA